VSGELPNGETEVEEEPEVGEFNPAATAAFLFGLDVSQYLDEQEPNLDDNDWSAEK